MSNSNASTVTYGHNKPSRNNRNMLVSIVDGSGDDGHRNRGYVSDGDHNVARKEKRTSSEQRRTRTENSKARDRPATNTEPNTIEKEVNEIGSHPGGAITNEIVNSTTIDSGGIGGTKRKSQSSRGSTDSNHSSHVSTTLDVNWNPKNCSLTDIFLTFTQSASSGSLLLTAANLEQLAQIHMRNELKQTANGNSRSMLQANVERLTSTYHANITTAAADGSPSTIITIGGTGGIGVGAIAGNVDRVKDADSVSLASSTHFTMVNGVGGPQRSHNSSLCDRGHQITVLILTMSVVFLIGICGAVFMLESKYIAPQRRKRDHI